MKKLETRSEHAHGIIFFFGDLNRDGALTEVELRRFFSGNVFAAHLDDLIQVLMSRDLDNSQSLDVNGIFFLIWALFSKFSVFDSILFNACFKCR